MIFEIYEEMKKKIKQWDNCKAVYVMSNMCL